MTEPPKRSRQKRGTDSMWKVPGRQRGDQGAGHEADQKEDAVVPGKGHGRPIGIFRGRLGADEQRRDRLGRLATSAVVTPSGSLATAKAIQLRTPIAAPMR